MDVWDIEWGDQDGTRLELLEGLSRDAAHQQAQRWLAEKPASQVLVYRRRGAVSVLIQILPADSPDSSNTEELPENPQRGGRSG